MLKTPAKYSTPVRSRVSFPMYRTRVLFKFPVKTILLSIITKCPKTSSDNEASFNISACSVLKNINLVVAGYHSHCFRSTNSLSFFGLMFDLAYHHFLWSTIPLIILKDSSAVTLIVHLLIEIFLPERKFYEIVAPIPNEKSLFEIRILE